MSGLHMIYTTCADEEAALNIARTLVDERYMLEEDIEHVTEQAAIRYDYRTDDTAS